MFVMYGFSNPCGAYTYYPEGHPIMAVERYTHVWINRLYQNNSTSFDLRVTDTLSEFPDFVVNKNFGGCIADDDPMLSTVATNEIAALDQQRTVEQLVSSGQFIDTFLSLVPAEQQEVEIRSIFATVVGVPSDQYDAQVLFSQLQFVQENYTESLLSILQDLTSRYGS